MGALDRFVDILRPFDERKSDWTIRDMAEATGVAASTVYRTVGALVSQGFLETSTEAHYRLGAIFIEFDRRMRLSDPLIREGSSCWRPAVRCQCAMRRHHCRLYRDQVICVAQDSNGSLATPTSYERGRPMPLLQGYFEGDSRATAARQACADLQGRWHRRQRARRDLRGNSAIGRRGYTVTRGEVDKGLVGVSVKIVCSGVAINTSVSLILAEADLGEALERRLLMTLLQPTCCPVRFRRDASTDL